jgi:hypothetical protein
MILLHVAMAVDGFIAGPAHDMSWTKGADYDTSSPLADEVAKSTGAILAGRGWYEVASGDSGGAVAGIRRGVVGAGPRSHASPRATRVGRSSRSCYRHRNRTGARAGARCGPQRGHLRRRRGEAGARSWPLGRDHRAGGAHRAGRGRAAVRKPARPPRNFGARPFRSERRAD